jgi:mono/diheme cytochrome c family protein
LKLSILSNCLIGLLTAGALRLAAAESSSNTPATFRQYCFQCHGKAAVAGLNLERLTSLPSVGEQFQHWQKIATALEQKRMPPKKMPQPSDEERERAVTWIRAKLTEFTAKNAGDPGRVTVRRLTSGEYAYTIRDLTGLDLKFDEFGTDSVGGEGFTNFGDVQFMADANLERYLEAAKKVADHAVIGAGPLQFFDDPGKSGFELSAISRINGIYRAFGFRANSGEGGKPYGLDRYSKAFYVAWRYQHRAALGEPKATLSAIAAQEGVSTRFAQHIWSVLHQPAPAYPISEVVAKWRGLAPPSGNNRQQSLTAARTGSEQVMGVLVNWPRWLFAAGAAAEGGQGDERALVLNEAALQANLTHNFKFVLRGRGQKPSTVYLSTESATGTSSPEEQVVLWRNATIRVRGKDRAAGTTQPLRAVLNEETIKRLDFGSGPIGVTMKPEDFSTNGSTSFEVELPEGAFGAELQVEAELAPGGSGDTVLRCIISDTEEVSKGRPIVALLGDPHSAGYEKWKSGVLEFARVLPMNSQGEPAPSDKDPIPAPFDNTYNQPERDHFHTKAKYYRTDRFLVEHVLDDATRLRLDQAWDDLLASFEYHNVLLRFTAEKYHLDNLKNKSIAELDEAQIKALPSEPRKYVTAFRAEYEAVQKAESSARPGHVEDCLRFAAKAWRRPLTAVEKERLRSFYVKATESGKLDHGKAIESLLARILISPAFLYRLEQPAQESSVKPLSNWELASRLSYFLWSSIPDQELRRAAATGELTSPPQIERQVKRMLADPKARRFSTEFFGQWLGFYRFDQSHGVDTTRFPEFTDEVKAAMYDEAVSFFEYIVRKDRPVREILHADYTFLNKPLAKHYGVKKEMKSATEPELVESASEFGRGGLLRLGAVLTATSAPLRTSPVKRGDWVLRRVLGTPTPPPPADAGSLPADDKLFGGLSVFERLEAHKRNPTCASCHTRIDPLGFPLEKYDSVGRVRETYSDGKPIRDSVAMADSTQIAGVDGLLQYLQTQEPQVLRTMSNKLLGYALGRTVTASDQPLIDRMTKAGGDATLSQLIAEIANSRQFRHRREWDEAPQTSAPQRQTAVTPAIKKSTKEGGI